jgi:hypothetical protein
MGCTTLHHFSIVKTPEILQSAYLMKVTLLLGACLLGAMGILSATTLDNATISYIQNDVSVADVKMVAMQGGSTTKTPATLNQAVNKNNAIVTGDKSRAELKFNDNTVVRLGQFTVFTFTEGTRDINLKQGSALLNVPKGLGRTNIKAAAVTAAITGTTVLFQAFDSYAAIYVYEGSVVGPNGETIGPGQVLIFENGQYRKESFDIKQSLTTGALFTKFLDSPNNDPFTLDAITRMIAAGLGKDLPENTDDNPQIDAILNKLIEIDQATEPEDPFNPYYAN